MKVLLVSVAFGLGGLLSQGAFAETAAAHTALCKDGTYFDGATHKGACRGHQGVKEWLDAKSDAKDTKADTKSAAKDSKATTDEMVTCKDGTTSKAGRGACRGHKGVDKTAGAAKAAPSTAAPATTSAPAATAAPAATGAAAATTAAGEKHTPPNPKEIAQKPGGGAGKVWVNSNSHVYHCEGDEWYGKTKEGSYMTEAAAKAEGDHASHGKDCSGK